MIRRFYIMPLDQGVCDEKAREMAKTFNDADLFIAGLHDSAASMDINSRTIIWENNFDNEENYVGPYMVHPYHCQSLDKYLLHDSPERITHDIFTARYVIPEGTTQLAKGVRRILLLHLEEGSDTSVFEDFDAAGAGMAMSVFSPENVVWVSGKGRSCTHIWDQGFTDTEALEQFLLSPTGLETTSRDGLARLGAKVQSLRVYTYHFELKGRQDTPALSGASPIFYSVTVQLKPEDVGTFIASLERDYDPFLAEHGTKLVNRWRGVESTAALIDVQSVWQLESFDVFHKWRGATNLRSNYFLANILSLVKGGQRRFYR